MIYREYTTQHCKEAQDVIDSIPRVVMWRSLTLLIVIIAVIVTGIVISIPEIITIPFEARYYPTTSTIMLQMSTDKAMPLIHNNVKNAVLRSSALPERYIDVGIEVDISKIIHYTDQNIRVITQLNMDSDTTYNMGIQDITGNITAVIPGKSFLQIMKDSRVQQ